MQEEAFAFEHTMAHRQLWASMAPLDRFSVMPYSLYPGTNFSEWHFDHQQAHNDTQGVFPGFFGETVGFLGPAFIIQDYDLNNWGQREWWTFQNHVWHRDAQLTQNSETFVFPFF